MGSGLRDPDRLGRLSDDRRGRPWRAVFLAFTGVALAAACGGSVNNDQSATGGTGGTVMGGTGGTGGTHHSGGTGGKDAGKDAKNDHMGGTGGYIDPGCPDAPPPPPVNECDPFGPNTCGDGEACYPYVQYPSGPCDQEQFGAVCAPVGTGTQGEPCTELNCAGGFVCVITGQGTECVQLCKLGGPNTCPKGLFCVPIDVEGYGGCY